MPCYHPIAAYRDAAGGPITIGEGGRGSSPLKLPCGRCIGCRKRRTKDWTTRILNEAAMHEHSIFITLTYRDPCNPSLNYEDFQKFAKKIRRTGRPIRYFVAGEYGDTNWRPHWHAILFGINFRDTYPVGKDLVASHEVDKLWHHGSHGIGEVNATTAGYTASYCIKKITGPKAEDHYRRVDPTTGEIIDLEPEMAHMSLNPGLGKTWYLKYQKEIHYARDAIVTNGGIKTKVPRYYDKILEKQNQQQLEKNKNKRFNEAIRRKADNTPQRLRDKEINEIAKQSQMRKHI